MTGSGLNYVALTSERAPELAALERASFPTADPAHLYDEDDLTALAADFPDGCFVGLDDDRAVAMGLGIRVEFDLEHPLHTIDDIVPHDGGSGHDPTGRWYYGTSIAVRPDYRRRGIGGELYELRKQVCRELGLAGIVAGGVIPGYADHKHELSADEYIGAVRDGRLYDRTRSFQLAHGFEAPRALPGYLAAPRVDDYAALIIWHTPDAAEARR
jgi:GNAT superfamily N-acetyltransferase